MDFRDDMGIHVCQKCGGKIYRDAQYKDGKRYCSYCYEKEVKDEIKSGDNGRN